MQTKGEGFENEARSQFLSFFLRIYHFSLYCFCLKRRRNSPVAK